MTKENYVFQVTGTLDWAKVFPGQEDTKYVEDGEYSVVVTVGEEDHKLISSHGCRVKPKEVEGGWQYRFKRKKVNPGVPALGGAPRVADDEGNLMEPCLIGNGSVGTVFVDVFNTKMGMGHRLVGLQILGLEVYEGGEGAKDALPF